MMICGLACCASAPCSIDSTLARFLQLHWERMAADVEAGALTPPARHRPVILQLEASASLFPFTKLDMERNLILLRDHSTSK
jgi:hypothetical protein